MKEKIKKFIIEDFMFGKGDLKDNEPLFESGIIDSLGFIKLLVFIEKKFDVFIDMSEITIGKFNTIDDIVKTIKDKMNT